jgi:hypothetical protein
MIKDAKGRKWLMRFKQYQQGWWWGLGGRTASASHRECGSSRAELQPWLTPSASFEATTLSPRCKNIPAVCGSVGLSAG